MSLLDARRFADDDSAETGIGTMIVFIAAVLVAAIAAGVLISTSGNLQEKSSRTGDEATEQVASNLQIESIMGTRTSTADTTLKGLDLYLGLAPGAADLDISEMRIQIQNATALQMLSYDDAAASATEFTGSSIRDADGSFTAANPVMSSGDLVKVHIDLTLASLEFSPREEVRVVLLPEVGNSVAQGFTTPNSYGTQTVLSLA